MTQLERVFTYYWLRKVEDDNHRRLERTLGVRWHREDFEERPSQAPTKPSNEVYIPLASSLSSDIFKFVRDQFQATAGRTQRTPYVPSAALPANMEYRSTGGKSDSGSLIAQGDYIPAPNEVVVTLDERFTVDQFKRVMSIGRLPGDAIPDIQVKTVNIESTAIDLPQELADFFRA